MTIEELQEGFNNTDVDLKALLIEVLNLSIRNQAIMEHLMATNVALVAYICNHSEEEKKASYRALQDQVNKTSYELQAAAASRIYPSSDD